MKKFFLLLTVILSASAKANDLTTKLKCALTYEETTYVGNEPIVKSQDVPLNLGRYNTLPPMFYLSARYVDSKFATDTPAFELHMQENNGKVAVSFLKVIGEKSVDLAYLQINKNQFLDIKIPVAQQEGELGNTLTKELHLVCNGRK